MRLRIEGSSGMALAIALALASGCSLPQARPQPKAQVVSVGRLRVEFVLPVGWEHLDHGRQQLFRHRDAQLSLRNLGVVDRDSALFELQGDPRRRELERRSVLTVRGAEWTDVRTWDRVSHQARSRFAGLVHDRSLLVLALDLGPYEQAGVAFDSLLASLRVTADSAVSE